MPDEIKGAEEIKGTRLKITALMSCPRLGFTDNFFCALSAFGPLGIQMAKESSAYWEQSMARLFYLRADIDDYIITVDYDSVFTHLDVIQLVELIHNSGADAVCSCQLKRDSSQMLMTVHPDEFEGDGSKVDIQKPMLRIRTGHFGLTIIRCGSLQKLPHPWFFSEPGSNLKWTDEDKKDADIWFWMQTQAAGWKTYQANNVRVGHIQRVITWPTPGGAVVHQYLDSYEKDGKPKSVATIPSLEAGGVATPHTTPPALDVPHGGGGDSLPSVAPVSELVEVA